PHGPRLSAASAPPRDCRVDSAESIHRLMLLAPSRRGCGTERHHDVPGGIDMDGGASSRNSPRTAPTDSAHCVVRPLGVPPKRIVCSPLTPTLFVEDGSRAAVGVGAGRSTVAQRGSLRTPRPRSWLWERPP